MNIYLRQGFFFYLLPAFLVGVGVQSLGFDFVKYFYLFLILTVGFFVLAIIRRQSAFLLVSLILFGFVLGLWRVSNSHPPVNTLLENKVGQSAVLVGTIVSDLDERENNTNFYLRLEESEDLILVATAIGLEAGYGDKVEVKGDLSLPTNFETDNGKTFDYVHYLEAKDIRYLLRQSTVEIVRVQSGISIGRALFDWKKSFVNKLKQVLPDPEVSLASGLVVGDKEGLGPDWQKAFRQAGIIHIVVLSGYNITIIAENVLLVFIWFMPQFVALSFSALGIVLFAIMVGGGATVIRASIMALLVVVARVFGRDYQIGYALLLACFFMVFYQPLILIFDVGFQLSFLATLGLIYGSPLVEKYLTKVPEKFGLRGVISATLAPQIFVLPWLAYSIGDVSVVAPIVNILVLPIIPLIMFLVFITGVFGFLSYWFSLAIATMSLVGLKYVLFVVEIFTRFEFVSISFSNFPFWLVFIWYLFYGIIFWRFYKSKNSLLQVGTSV